MAWLELRIQAELSNHSALEEALFAAGALSVTTLDAADSPIFEPDPDNPPIWPDPLLVGLFAAEADKVRIERLMIASGHVDAANLNWEILEDRVWETEWASHYKPMHFGKNFWVYSDPVDEPGAQTLLLDPGLAFGTGTHATTALCLEWLVNQPIANHRVLDFGCGSGVLGIASLLLGASHCTFVDIDQQALQATKNNLAKNRLDPGQVTLLKAPIEITGLQTDIVLANILCEPLVELAEALCSSLSEGGSICLSGVLDHQVESLLQAYRPWLNRIEVTGRDEWRCISGRVSSTG